MKGVHSEHRWRINEVETGARWAQNMIAEVLGNHGAYLTPQERDGLKLAQQGLADFSTAKDRAKRDTDKEIKACERRNKKAKGT